MEQSFVAWAKMRARRLPQIKLGIGDDAAVLANSGNDTVVTTDSQCDGIHFRLGEVSARQIGRKLVNVNLSDLAAMAAEPKCVFLSMCLPNQATDSETEIIAAEIYEGVCEALEHFDTALAGGDTNCWDGPLSLNMTAVGSVVDDVVWRRDGIQADDAIIVTGPLGGSIAGKHLDFLPRIDLMRQIRGKIDVHAAMDISDGLSVDLLRMCDASNCGAILELDSIPITNEATKLSETSGKSPVEHALGDGEDFELLLSVPAEAVGELQQLVGAENAIKVGEFTSRTGLWSRTGSKIHQLTSSGYVHGR
ncbi:MAG: thiamine-phosphate kinase [Aureliella sp.]